MSFSWLDVLVPAGVTAAAFVVLILLSKMVEFFRNYEKPRPSLSYPCPSCGFLVFTEPAGSFDICEICGWQDDIVQLADPTHGGGANSDSLARSQSVILKSLPLEILEHNGFRRDPRWRPLRDDDLKERSAEEPAYYWLQNEETGS